MAAIFVVDFEIARSTFSDSLVHVANASLLTQDVDPISLRFQLSSFLAVKLSGGLGYGGSVFVAPLYELAASVSISSSNFLRSQVLASSNNYDFLVNSDISENGMFLQGGALALLLPVQQKSIPSSSGYVVAITNSSFSQCLVLSTSEVIASSKFDIVMGGAISIFDFVPNIFFNQTSFPAPSRVILQGLVFSGTFLSFSFVAQMPFFRRFRFPVVLFTFFQAMPPPDCRTHPSLHQYTTQRCTQSVDRLQSLPWQIFRYQM